MEPLGRNIKRAIQEADRYVRQRGYRCLVPGCKARAIHSHAIPRSSFKEALAANGVVYTLDQSFGSTMTMKSVSDPLPIIETGINRAGVFKGYCAPHDALLFASAETKDPEKKNGAMIALHLRALSLEYCRKRQVSDFWKKLSDLVAHDDVQSYLQKRAAEFIAAQQALQHVYLGSLFRMISGSPVDAIEYCVIPFSRNLQISCCGCFDAVPGDFQSVLAYNLISYQDFSFFCLTSFKAQEHYLNSFLSKNSDIEALINDIALSHCEEPLISPRLWTSLNEDQRISIMLSIRHPHARDSTLTTPRIIKIRAGDGFVDPASLTSPRMPFKPGRSGPVE